MPPAPARPTTRIDFVPNMRLLCNKYDDNVSMPPKAGLYRSSKPDRLRSEDLNEFRSLGIKCIIDFRSQDEYFGTDGSCLLDEEYTLHKVVPPKKVGQSITFQNIENKDNLAAGKVEAHGPNLSESDVGEKKHFLINFFTSRYILRTFSRLPCYLYCVGIFHLICDLFKRDKTFKNFGKFFTSQVLNRTGIKRQYIDIVEFCQPAICTALKLIVDPQNLPALLNCAHGKDRTGIVSALVLSCLGMEKEFIAEEYALSEEGLEPIKHLVHQDIVVKYQLNEEFISAKADTMRNLLLYIEDKYGSVENYLEAIGFSRAEQATLQATFVAPDPQSLIHLHMDSQEDASIMDDPIKTLETSPLRSRVGN